jgi:hypothetical protein
MLAMFAFLGGWFYKDAASGYRKQNEAFAMNRAFLSAEQIYQKRQQDGLVTDAEWKKYASQQTVDFGNDPQLLPADLVQPVSWPEELQDSTLIAKGHSAAWEVYTGRRQWDRKPPEKWHEAGSIREQWYVAYALTALALSTAFVLIRTSRRSMSIEGEMILAQDGRRVRMTDLTRLDLRKWSTKGLAFAHFSLGQGKEGKIRIDGLTYGGFLKEQGEPAEQFMQILRQHFTGELIEYATDEPAAPAASPSAAGEA